MNFFELERFVSRQLRGLPAPSAPQTLVPRVLAAASAWSRRPWYAREWFVWPLGWQLASVALVAVVAAAGSLVLPAMQLLMLDAARSWTSALLTGAPQLTDALALAVTAARVMWRSLIQPFLPYASVLVLIMGGACATVALALNRLMSGRVLHS